MKQAQDYENRILLAIVGNSPAVVTETLYALTQTEERPYIPTEIQIITNAGSYQHIIDTLLGKHGKVKQCCDDYDIPPLIFSESNIYQIESKNGTTLEDVTTKEDNTIIADYLTNKVRELTANDDTSLHVSIAGGRKTMTYYLGYAMSVFGRIQDTMSHVIVDDIFFSKDFYYPTPEREIIKSYKGKEFNASEVDVMLGYLPYIRLRDKLANKLLDEEGITFSEIIDAAQTKLEPPRIELRNKELFFGNVDLTVKLSNKELSLYLLILTHHKFKSNPVVINKIEKNKDGLIGEFLAIYGEISGDSKHTSKYHHEGETRMVKDPLDQDNITSTQSRINGKIKKALGESLAKPYLIKSSGKQFNDILIYSFSDEIKPDSIDIPTF